MRVAEHFADDEAGDEHEDGDAGEGHGDDSDSEDEVGHGAADEGFEGGGELHVAAVEQHGGDAEFSWLYGSGGEGVACDDTRGEHAVYLSSLWGEGGIGSEGEYAVFFDEYAVVGLGVKEGAGCDDDTGGGDEEGDDHAGGEVEDGEAAVFFAPAFGSHGEGEEEGHVDADGCGGGGYDDVALLAENGIGPEGARFGVGDGIEECLVAVAWLEDEGGIGDEAGDDFAEGESVIGEGELDGDSDEGEDDDADNDF